MINEKDIENFVKLNRWDLAHLAIKHNEDELDKLRKEVKALREQLKLLKEIK
jgi:cell division protein FtsB